MVIMTVFGVDVMRTLGVDCGFVRCGISEEGCGSVFGGWLWGWVCEGKGKSKGRGRWRRRKDWKVEVKGWRIIPG